MMTVVAIMAGLLPILWSTGTGSEVMQRIVVPMIGGTVSWALLVLFTNKVQMVGSMVGQRPCLNKTLYKTVTCGSLRLRQGLCRLLILERALSQLNGDGCRFTTADA